MKNKKTFINKDGEERELEFDIQATPLTGIFWEGQYWQRKYPKFIIWLNAWLSRRNADLLKYF